MSVRRAHLSSSASGRPIAIATTGSPGTPIHTAGGSSIAAIHLWAHNYGLAAMRRLSLEFGGTAAKDRIELDLPPDAKSLPIVIPSLVLTNTKVLAAFADVGSEVAVAGYVNVCTPPTDFGPNRIALSSSVDGLGIDVAATTTPGTLIHTTTSDAQTIDWIFLWAFNRDTVSRRLTIEFGGTATKDLRRYDLPANIQTHRGLVNVIPGLELDNSQVVRAFGAAANQISVFGYVNRLKQP